MIEIRQISLAKKLEKKTSENLTIKKMTFEKMRNFPKSWQPIYISLKIQNRQTVSEK